jgi:hypothetical protein
MANELITGKTLKSRGDIYEINEKAEDNKILVLSINRDYEIIHDIEDKFYYYDNFNRLHECLKCSAWRIFDLEKPSSN